MKHVRVLLSSCTRAIQSITATYAIGCCAYYAIYAIDYYQLTSRALLWYWAPCTVSCPRTMSLHRWRHTQARRAAFGGGFIGGSHVCKLNDYERNVILEYVVPFLEYFVPFLEYVVPFLEYVVPFLEYVVPVLEYLITRSQMRAHHPGFCAPLFLSLSLSPSLTPPPPPPSHTHTHTHFLCVCVLLCVCVSYSVCVCLTLCACVLLCPPATFG
jgi:hypothetical protein